MTMYTPGYEFHCRSCKILLAIKADSEKNAEVKKDGDALIKCPNCWTMELYDKYDFRVIKDISKWDEDDVLR